MAELPELRSDGLGKPSPPPPLFRQPPAFGVARELELMKRGEVSPRVRRPPRHRRLPLPRMEPRPDRHRRWSGRETGPVDLWHRLLCRLGRHDMRGGHQLQLGSEFVYVERRCRWCDAPA